MLQSLAKKHRGFTLVELLVVIAIIGLLSTIVLVSFGPVRTQARDTTIKANLSQMRLVAEIYYNEQCDEVGGCTYVTPVGRADYDSAAAAVTAAGGTVTDEFDTDAFCIQSTLSNGTDIWCIDSNGFIGTDAGFDECDAANHDCDDEV